MPKEQTQSHHFIHRWHHLDSLLNTNNLDALVLNPCPSLVYLTELHFHLSERPVVFIYTPSKDPILILPELELAKVQSLPYPLEVFPYGEEPSQWQQLFRQAVIAADIDTKVIGFEPRNFRMLEYGYVHNAAPEANYRSAEAVIAALRMQKDSTEIAAMRQAVLIAQNALLAMLPAVKIGTTEYELAAELTLQLLRHGSDAAIPFTPIVSAGPNSANPHAAPTNRPLQDGDLLVIDWGASYHGYFSDITRTFSIGEIKHEENLICQVVFQANTAGRNAVRPGTTAHAIDLATRNVVESAGFGKFFTHRTGHGLGMEGHEEPYIRSGNDLLVAPGMTFTIEPGIYLPNRNGVRIEDDVAVTDSGVESLTTLPREVTRLI